MTGTPEQATIESIGERLRRLRVERELSQRELSSPGVSYAYISRIEAGTRQPSVKALRKLARKLNVSPEYLETGSEMRDVDERELRLANAELELRLARDPAAAERELQLILGESVAAGDVASASRARIGLGLAAAEQGRHDEAVVLLEQGLEDGRARPSARPDVYATLGQSYATVGEPARAVELFDRCLDEIAEQTPEDVAGRVRFATYLSYALTDLGDLERAQTVLREVLSSADTFADPYTRVRLFWSLGRLAGAQGEATNALDYIRRAIALLETTEDTLHLARAHILCAWSLNNAGKADEVGPYLETAESLLGPRPEQIDVAGLRTEQARRLVALGSGAEGVARAREALELYADSNPAEQGIAWRALGEGLGLQDEIDAATEAFRRSVEQLTLADRTQDCVQTYRTWGRFLREAGREAQALDALEKAADLAVRVAAPARA
ncbi:MAG: helix-turn-helix domain-containing protein [Gaiellaceae bacterium]